MTAAAKGEVGVRVAEEDSMGSALADDAMAFKAACTIAADAYEPPVLPLSPLPAQQSSHNCMSTPVVHTHVFTVRCPQTMHCVRSPKSGVVTQVNSAACDLLQQGARV